MCANKVRARGLQAVSMADNLLAYTLQRHKDPNRKLRRWLFSLITPKYILVWYEVTDLESSALDRVLGILSELLPLDYMRVSFADNPVLRYGLKVEADQFIVLPAENQTAACAERILDALSEGRTEVRYTLTRSANTK